MINIENNDMLGEAEDIASIIDNGNNYVFGETKLFISIINSDNNYIWRDENTARIINDKK
jgi:hypothetical protein